MYFCEVLDHFRDSLKSALTRKQANVFDAQHLKGASSRLVQSMFQIGRKAAELERSKLQSEIQKKQSELREKRLQKRLDMASKEPSKGPGPVKNPKRAKTEPEEEEAEDLEELMEEPTQPRRRKTPSVYSALGKDEFITESKDRKSRLDARQKRIAAAEADKEDEDHDNEEEETEKERLERETKQLQSELQKAEKAAAAARDKKEREKAKRFSERLQQGKFLKQPKAVTLVAVKKRRKSLKTEPIKSADEEDEPDEIPDGFHLHEESPHCLNMKRSEDYQAYLRQVVAEFERLLKAGGKDMCEAYGQIIESFYWACKANKNNIIDDADRDAILQSIKDPTCKAWKMKLSGRKALDPTAIIREEPIGPQTASEMVSMKPEEMFEQLEEEIAMKTPAEVRHIKDTIKNLCKSQAAAPRHAANSADYLATLTDVLSIPASVKIMNATLRPVVAIKIPEVDDMMDRVQQKVEAIKKAKEAAGGMRPIDQVVFAQNCPSYNPEWAHSLDGKPTAYLASLVTRYMDERMRKDSQMVMSACSLETIYRTPSSSVGKLISGKHYMGRYELDKIRDKKGKEGVELPQRTRHKLPAKPSTSAMSHD